MQIRKDTGMKQVALCTIVALLPFVAHAEHIFRCDFLNMYSITRDPAIINMIRPQFLAFARQNDRVYILNHPGSIPMGKEDLSILVQKTAMMCSAEHTLNIGEAMIYAYQNMRRPGNNTGGRAGKPRSVFE
jgi:hypothetical protein